MPSLHLQRLAKTIASLGLLALLASARAEPPAPPAGDAATRLVVALRSAALYKAMAAAYVARAGAPANPDDAKFQAFMRRVVSLPEASLQPFFANAYRRGLTTSELNTLAIFFEGPVGRRLADQSVASQSVHDGDPRAAARAHPITEEERATLKRFTESDVYRKYARFASSQAFGAPLMEDMARAPEFADLGLVRPARR